MVTGRVLSAQVVEQGGLGGSTLYAAEVRFLYNVHARTREGVWTSRAQPSLASAAALAGRLPRGAAAMVAYDAADPARAELRVD